MVPVVVRLLLGGDDPGDEDGGARGCGDGR